MVRDNFYEGMLYQIEYKPEFSQSWYTRKQVYHITTVDDNYPHAHQAIAALMNDNSWTKGEYTFRNQQNPGMGNALHPYHEFSYNEDLDVYVYTYVLPYDD